jgi:hypothetical protein
MTVAIGARSSAIASGSLAAALALSACSGGGVIIAPSGAATAGVVSASIGVSATAPGPFVNYGCAVIPQAAPSFDIIVTTTRTADLESVTIRLINGSELGGPMITFPKAPLTTQFGTRRIVAGTPRTFTLSPQFVCGPTRPQSVAASIAVVEPTGETHTVSVSRPLP